MTMMNNGLIANKDEISFDFHQEVYKDLLDRFSHTLVFKENKIIRLPHVYQRLGTVWHLRKKQSFKVLKDLERLGLVELVAFHGIILNT